MGLAGGQTQSLLHGRQVLPHWATLQPWLLLLYTTNHVVIGLVSMGSWYRELSYYWNFCYLDARNLIFSYLGTKGWMNSFNKMNVMNCWPGLHSQLSLSNYRQDLEHTCAILLTFVFSTVVNGTDLDDSMVLSSWVAWFFLSYLWNSCGLSSSSTKRTMTGWFIWYFIL